MENLQPFLLKTFQLDRTKCLKIALCIPRALSNLLSAVSEMRCHDSHQEAALGLAPGAFQPCRWRQDGLCWRRFVFPACSRCQVTATAAALAQVNYSPLNKFASLSWNRKPNLRIS